MKAAAAADYYCDYCCCAIWSPSFEASLDRLSTIGGSPHVDDDYDDSE